MPEGVADWSGAGLESARHMVGVPHESDSHPQECWHATSDTMAVIDRRDFQAQNHPLNRTGIDVPCGLVLDVVQQDEFLSRKSPPNLMR